MSTPFREEDRMRVEILRVDGKREEHVVDKRTVFDDLVADNGHARRLPRNAEATKLYHSVCRPGVMLTSIVGDVAIVRDADFA